VDAHGLVHRVDHVYAVGDGTDFPVKQGGIATQQADAVAEVIAKRAGARVDPRPLRPVLGRYLLANDSNGFLRGELHQRDGRAFAVPQSTMWWPAGKIAGTYLAPYLAALGAGAMEASIVPGDRPLPVTSWVEASAFGE
jgi:sulfide:quinone oxidoreductase